MGDYNSRIRWKFRFLAGFYDVFDLFFVFGADANPRKALARSIPDGPVRVLDVCAGTGNSSIAVATANPECMVRGIDLSPDMAAVAKRKIAKRNITNLSIDIMDATDMKFDDGEFDVVMVSFALHEMGLTLMLEVLKEMARVLKPGGSIFIIDYERESVRIVDFCFDVYLKIFEPAHMPEFLDYDWRDILEKVGCEKTGEHKYRFSKLISGRKFSLAA